VTHVTSADGTRIGYRSTGTGPGVVVLSGALLTGADYAALAGHLSGSLTLHLVDRRGRGASGPQGAGYGIEAECADAAAVLRATGARGVFGHSFGGLVALQTALRHPDLLDRVAAFEPGVSVEGSLPSGFVPALARAVDEGRRARGMTLLLRGLLLAGPLNRAPLPLATAASWLLLRTVGRSMGATLPTVPAEIRASVAVDGPASAYAPITAKTLLLTGERGPAYLRTAAAAVAAAIPGAALTELPGDGHSAPQQQPGRVAAALLPFLTG
jgi:pimeloyl-ACP methyl ester carboxylesterase